MIRDRWPKPLRSSGANQRALRSASGVFLRVMAYPRGLESGDLARDAPLADRLAFDCTENEVLDHKSDDDHGQKACKDRRNIEEVPVLEDEPSKAALPR